MDGLHFTPAAIVTLVLQGVLMIALPAVLLVIWKKKTRAPLVVPVVIGASTWFVFAILLKIAPAYFLLQANNPVAAAVRGNIWLSYLIAGVLAGVFEETGRFVAFRFLLKKQRERRAAVSYGIGHGGFESVYAGFQVIALAVLGLLLTTAAGDQILAGMSEADQALLAAQLAPLARATVAECLLGVLERVSAITIHVALSVLVFAAVREKRHFFLYPVAVFLHALFDFSIAFYGAGLLPVFVLELLLLALAALVAYFAWRLYRTLGAVQPMPVGDGEGAL